MSYGQKSFPELRHKGFNYKTFVCDLLIFVLSLSVCYTWLEKLKGDKHSSLLQKFISYGQKGFPELRPKFKVAWQR
jgi:hypothetical protein